MKKLDLRRIHKHLYQPSARKVEVVDVPELSFIMLDGKIEKGHAPGDSPSLLAAIQALFGISYTLKFQSKLRKKNAIDYPVMPLEALWWVEDGRFELSKPDNWCWRAMMMQPEHIDAKMFDEALVQLRAKKPSPALKNLRLERFCEGLCIQTMHLGPYSSEPATVERMHAFAQENGYLIANQHHEIYRGDPLRSAPEKLKTVLRHQAEKR